VTSSSGGDTPPNNENVELTQYRYSLSQVPGAGDEHVEILERVPLVLLQLSPLGQV
jgi:hypothetical protein